MALRTGAKESEAAAKASQFGRDRIKNLDLSDAEGGDGLIIRFLIDIHGWPVVDTHSFVPTKPRPANVAKENKWPDKMWAVCPNDQFFLDDAAMAAGDGETPVYEDGYGSCYIHEHYAEILDKFKTPYSVARAQTFALVVLRERVGNIIRDKTETITGKDGKDINVPAIRLVQQQWKRFFSHVNAAAFEDASVLCKDFVITKKGTGQATEITVQGLSLTEDHHPAFLNHPKWGKVEATKSWQVYEDALALMGANGDLLAILRGWASENWMKLWFWPGEWDEEGKSRGAIGGDETESPAAGTEVSSEEASLSEDDEKQLAEFRARLLNKDKK